MGSPASLPTLGSGRLSLLTTGPWQLPKRSAISPRLARNSADRSQLCFCLPQTFGFYFIFGFCGFYVSSTIHFRKRSLTFLLSLPLHFNNEHRQGTQPATPSWVLSILALDPTPPYCQDLHVRCLPTPAKPHVFP